MKPINVVLNLATNDDQQRAIGTQRLLDQGTPDHSKHGFVLLPRLGGMPDAQMALCLCGTGLRLPSWLVDAGGRQ